MARITNPQVTTNHQLYIGELRKKGNLVNAYSPLQNFVDPNTNYLGDFTTEKLQFDYQHPVDVQVSKGPVGSTDILLTDNNTIPKIINSRFAVQNDNEYEIIEEYGFKQSNIYSEPEFSNTHLIKNSLTIPKLDFLGLDDSGRLGAGSYIIYFRLSSLYGIESDICAESGIIQLYIGKMPHIRMGLQDENTNKTIKFLLTNIDESYQYVHIYYSRTSSAEDQAATTRFYKVHYDYPIQYAKSEISLTGFEDISEITKEECFSPLQYIERSKTQALNSNRLFLGNNTRLTRDYQTLQALAWKIIPKQIQLSKGDIGCVNRFHQDLISDEDKKNGYYNPLNVYKFTGYWPDEIYRFGVVYLFEDGSQSPCFDLQGIDFSYNTNPGRESFFELDKQNNYIERLYQPNNSENSTNEMYFFDKNIRTNTKGVIKFAKVDNYELFGGNLYPKPVGIEFDLSNIHVRSFNSVGDITYADSPQDFLKQLGIKGLFFVRKKRIPTIIAQGIAIGLTGKDFGALPVIKHNTNYKVQSFLSGNRIISPEGNFVTITSDVKVNALLVPDAEMQEATFNQLFVSNEFAVQKIGQLRYSGEQQDIYGVSKSFTSAEKYQKCKLTNVPESTNSITNGEEYFSTIAGSDVEAHKTSDVNHAWRWTKPQDLTTSTSVVRGNWGAFVGMSNEGGIEYGDIVNIKDSKYIEDEDLATNQDFYKYFIDSTKYYAISDRIDSKDINTPIQCFRGDCFISQFTHRMYRNFIDKELPTNKQIVNPNSWAENYGVRCTAEIILNAHSNLTSDSEGWFLRDPSKYEAPSWKDILIQILTGNILGLIVQAASPEASEKELMEKAGITDKDNLDLIAEQKYDSSIEDWVKTYYPNGFSNEIVQAFEVHISEKDRNSKDYLHKKVNPAEQEAAGGLNLKAVFKSDTNWKLRGIASISRADINAVGLGQWITFPICSNMNYALRDVDYSNATEEASFNRKRSFYPLMQKDMHNPLRDSNCISQSAKITIPTHSYTPFNIANTIKQEYFNEIIISEYSPNFAVESFYRYIKQGNKIETDKTLGSITKIISISQGLLIILTHGIQVAKFSTATSITEDFISGIQIITLNDTFGSIWKDSIIKTDNAVYGIDSVAKKIWKVDLTNLSLELISDSKVGKFLIDNLDMSEYTQIPFIGRINIKTHYNKWKHDVIFTYYNDIPYDGDSRLYLSDPNNKVKEYLAEEYNNSNNDRLTSDISAITDWKEGKQWSLCYNEVTKTFTTFYDWYPIESENINNIYFSFDKDKSLEISPSNNILKLYINQNYYTEFADKIIIKKYEIDPIEVQSITSYVIDSNVKNLYINIPQTANALIFYVKINDEWWLHAYNPKNLISDDIIAILNNPNITEIADIHYLEGDEEIIPATIKKQVSELGQDYYNLRRSKQNSLLLWKHGQAGIFDNQGEIKPTNWYGKQHEFNFEFVVNEASQIQKIWNNIKIISNKVEPMKFEFEVVGECYEWMEYKYILGWVWKRINEELENNPDDLTEEQIIDKWFKYTLDNSIGAIKTQYSDFPTLFDKEDSYTIQKLPFLKVKEFEQPGIHYSERYRHDDYPGLTYLKGSANSPILPLNRRYNSDNTDTVANRNNESYTENSSVSMLIYDKQLNEYRVRTEQLGNNIKKFGRIRGNMHYLEDLWNIEVRPITFVWKYSSGEELEESKIQETRLRDKYVKIKVRYSGEDLAVIQAIQTLFDYSFA